MKISIVLTLITISIFSACSKKADKTTTLDEKAFFHHIEEIASDKFMGRKPGTDGEKITIDYLQKEYEKLGLKPMNDGSYLQPIPLVEISTEYQKSLAIDGKGKQIILNHGTDYVAVTKRIEEKIEIKNTELVFAGYGIVAPEYNWNDYEGIDVKNKIVVVIVNDPGYFSNDTTLFTGKKMTYYGRWTYKYEEAARQGAAGVLIIHEDKGASYPWAVVQNGRMGPQLVLDDKSNDNSKCKFEGWITNEKAKEIFSLAGLNLNDELKAAATRGFKSKPMSLFTSLVMKNKLTKIVTNNVLGYIPGTERPDEYIFFMAHWDHFGVDTTLKGDQIFNGALDNATGVAGILSIAKAINELPEKPKRSCVFFSITLEEFGLMGSDYYAKHPLVPNEKVIAAVNIDAVNIWGQTKNFSVIGYGMSELDEIIKSEADKMEKTIMPDSNPEAGSYFRSDHFSLAKVGIPAVYVASGNEHMTKPKEYMPQATGDWIKNHYHKVTDEYWPDKWDRESMMEHLRLVYNIGVRLANESTHPKWYENSPYKKLREKNYKIITPKSISYINYSIK
jgi:Zn-dependent M28 family amino/carboxypeptidase